MTNDISNVTRQAKYWDYFSRIVPLAFVVLAAVFYFNHNTDLEILVWIGIILFCLTSLVWWWWTLRTIIKLSIVLNDAQEKFYTLHHDLSTIKDNITHAKSTGSRQRTKSSKD